jgi:hypothetical protein
MTLAVGRSGLGQATRFVAVPVLAVLTILTGLFGAAGATTGVVTVPQTHRAADGSCVVTGGTGVSRTGSAPLAIAPKPNGVAVVWLPGLNSAKCRTALTRGGATLARRLASDIAHAPYAPSNVFSCPLDDGTAARVTFTFRHRQPQTVGVHLRGCAFMSGPGTRARTETASFRADLRSIAPPAWRPYLSRSRARADRSGSSVRSNRFRRWRGHDPIDKGVHRRRPVGFGRFGSERSPLTRSRLSSRYPGRSERHDVWGVTLAL